MIWGELTSLTTDQQLIKGALFDRRNHSLTTFQNCLMGDDTCLLSHLVICTKSISVWFLGKLVHVDHVVGGKRLTSKQTDDYICRKVKAAAFTRYCIARYSQEIEKRGLCFRKPIEKPYLKVQHRHLRLRFAKEFLESSVSFWRPRFPRSYTKRHLKFRHLTQLFIWRVSWPGTLSFEQK